jgi:hypothetical protein
MDDGNKAEIINQMFDWILFQKQVYRQKDQPSANRAVNLKNHLL